MFKCGGCGVDVSIKHGIKEYAYMLTRQVWQYIPKNLQRKMLCVACVEKELDRPLTILDFDWSVPLTNYPHFERSDRLKAAMEKQP